jgi:hypothetical protein
LAIKPPKNLPFRALNSLHDYVTVTLWDTAFGRVA